MLEKVVELNAIDPGDYALPDGLSEAEIAERLKDPLVRICNLYWIKNAEGEEIKFIPNLAQCVLLHEIYIEGKNRLLVPKARQL